MGAAHAIQRRTSISVQIDQRLKHSKAFSRLVQNIPKSDQESLIDGLKELEINLQTMPIDPTDSDLGVGNLHKNGNYSMTSGSYPDIDDSYRYQLSASGLSDVSMKLPLVDRKESHRGTIQNPYLRFLHTDAGDKIDDGITKILLKIGIALKVAIANPSFPYDLSFRGDSEFLGAEMLREELWNVLNLSLSSSEIFRLINRFDIKGNGTLDVVELFAWSLGAYDKRKRSDKIMKPKKMTSVTKSEPAYESTNAEVMKEVELKLAKAALETIRLHRTHMLRSPGNHFLAVDEFLALLGEVEVLLSDREADLLCMKYFVPYADAIDVTQFAEDFINAGKCLARDEIQNRALESFKSAVHTTQESVSKMMEQRQVASPRKKSVSKKAASSPLSSRSSSRRNSKDIQSSSLPKITEKPWKASGRSRVSSQDRASVENVGSGSFGSFSEVSETGRRTSRLLTAESLQSLQSVTENPLQPQGVI